MKVKKIVTLDRPELLEFLRKYHPGLSKATYIDFFDGRIDAHAKIEVSWEEDEIIDGVFEEKK